MGRDCLALPVENAIPAGLRADSLAALAGAGQSLALSAYGLAHQPGKKRRSIQRFPLLDRELDEYPSLPFYSLDEGDYFYDSTGLAQHLDQRAREDSPALIPTEPLLAFLCQLIDEAFDEFGLYMVHHMRWVGSARTTAMGTRSAAEMRHLFPLGLHRLVAWQLPRRQVRRCPYLFSVARQGFDAGLSAELTPPSRPDFPPTHALLDRAWVSYLEAMEALLAEQPYLLGDRFTLADASAYGQLSMNLVDGAASDRLAQEAPRTYQWLCELRDGKHVHSEGELYLSSALEPLLEIIGATFLPLMAQNLAAYQEAIAAGETLFNEAAFDAGRALYEGSLMGEPFRAVIKTFQVRVWRELLASWRQLSPANREQLAAQLGTEGRESLQ